MPLARRKAGLKARSFEMASSGRARGRASPARAVDGRSRRTKLLRHQRGLAGDGASICFSPIGVRAPKPPPTCHLPLPPRCHAAPPDRRCPCATCGSPPARPAVRAAKYVHDASFSRPAPQSDRVGRRTGHAPHHLSNTQIHPRGTICRRGAHPLARKVGVAGAVARRMDLDGRRAAVGSIGSRG